MKVIQALSIVCLSLGLSLTARAENLLQIYNLAKENDTTLKAAAANRDAVIEARPQAVAGVLPNLTGGADTTYNDQESKSGSVGFFAASSSDDRYNSNGYNLTLRQPLFRMDNFLRLGQSDELVAQAEAEYLYAQLDLIVRVSDAYFAVLAAQDNLAFTQAEKAAIGRQLEQAKQRFEVGLIAITDVHEAQAAYDLAVAEEILAEAALATAYEGLQVITNQPVNQVNPVKQEIPLLKPDPADMEEWVSQAIEQNPRVISSRHASEVARREINITRSAHLPAVDIVASRFHTQSDGGVSGQRETDTDAIALQLNWNLFEGGAKFSRTRQASARFQESSQNLERQVRITSRDTRDAYRNTIAGISRIKALKQAVVSNQSALEATEAGFEVGTRTIVDVLQSQRDLFRAKRDYSRSRYVYLVQTLQLKQAAGILNEQDIENINLLLQ